MLIKIEIKSVDGTFSKEISARMCLQKVNYRVVTWNDHQNKWLHLTLCNFPKPANDELVDLLIFVEKMVDLSPDSDHLGGDGMVHLTKTRPREHDLMLSVLD